MLHNDNNNSNFIFIHANGFPPKAYKCLHSKIDIKYKLHYNNNAYIDVVIVVYESSQEPYVDWKKGDEQA